jgi:hypothetical protein
MLVRMTPESELCACTKNVLFSSSALIEQRSLHSINTLLINSKNRWSNKAELENRTLFAHAHNSDSGVMRTRMTLSGYGITFLSHGSVHVGSGAIKNKGLWQAQAQTGSHTCRHSH